MELEPVLPGTVVLYDPVRPGRRTRGVGLRGCGCLLTARSSTPALPVRVRPPVPSEGQFPWSGV